MNDIMKYIEAKRSGSQLFQPNTSDPSIILRDWLSERAGLFVPTTSPQQTRPDRSWSARRTARR